MLENDTLEIMEERDKQLKPCPFCGGKAVIYGKGNSKSVYCKNDNCRLGLAPKIQGIEDKIKEWNKRA